MRKRVYPYEYMDDWEKFNETSLPEKQELYNHWNMEDINDADYVHVKIFWNKKFWIISWFACSKWYFIVSWYVWEL